MFRSVPRALFALQVKQFSLLPSASFLVITDEEPLPIAQTQNVRVSVADASRYQKLATMEQTINLIIKNINSRPRRTKGIAETVAKADGNAGSGSDEEF